MILDEKELRICDGPTIIYLAHDTPGHTAAAIGKRGCDKDVEPGDPVSERGGDKDVEPGDRISGEA